VTVILFPFHQDEPVGDDCFPLPEGVTPRRVAPELPGDPPPPEQPPAAQWPRLSALYGQLADAVSAELPGSAELPADGGPLTVVVGDCCAVLGTLAGVQRAGVQPGIVWFDAHGDVHTLASSTSGYLGGMPLRMAVGGDPEVLARPLGLRPVPEQHAVLVDARDLDPGEVEYLAGSAVRRLPVPEVDGDLLAGLPLLVHVDLDVVDAAELTGVRFPALGGPSAAEVVAAVRRLLATGRVAVLELSCPWYPPTSEAEDRTRADLLAALLAPDLGDGVPGQSPLVRRMQQLAADHDLDGLRRQITETLAALPEAEQPYVPRALATALHQFVDSYGTERPSDR
jgi:arginase